MERKPKSLAIHFGSRLARPSIQIFRIPRVWKRNNPTLPRKLVRAATSPGGDQRSFPQTPILASFLRFPSSLYSRTYASFHPRIVFTICFISSSRPLHLFARSKTRRRCKQGGMRFSLSAYPSINISPYPRDKQYSTRFSRNFLSE